MHIGDPVPKALTLSLVRDREGHERTLSSFWAHGPALLIFIRRFGCLCLSAQITELKPRLPELHRLGLRTVFIGNGQPHFIDGFVERFAMYDHHIDIVTDPTLASFRAVEMLRSWWATYGPKAIWDQIRATGAGHINRWGEGDTLQQGGIVLVDSDGCIAWYHRNASKGGHPASVEVVDAALRLALKQAPLPI